jgi:hypothetical protein
MFHRLILLLAALGVSSAYALTPEAIVESYFKMQVVRGYYSQTHEVVGFPRPTTTDGTFLIVPQRAIMWEEKGLFPTKTIYRDNSFHIYQEIGLDRVFRAGTPVTNMANRVLWALFSGDFIGLRQDFTIEVLPDGFYWTMNFYPKSSLARATVKNIQALGSPVPYRVEYLTVSGDKTTIDLYGLQQTSATLTSEENALANP